MISAILYTVFGGLYLAPIVTAVIAFWFLRSRGQTLYSLMSWFIKSTLVFLVDLPMSLLGLIIVAVALPFRTVNSSMYAQYTQYPERGFWRYEALPHWAKLWGNVNDGLVSDKRGWFANWFWEKFSWLATGGLISYSTYDYLQRYWWTAIRNPANYWSRISSGIDISRCRVAMLLGTSRKANEEENGWHFLCAMKDDGKKYYLFQVAQKYPFSSRYGFYCRFGWKMELDEEYAQGERVGSCYKFSPMKDLL